MTAGSRGFTLIEVMVVMLIISIVFIGGVVLLDRGTRGQVDEAFSRFNALLELARSEAMMNASHRGVAFQRDGYGFYRLTPQGQWILMDEKPFQPSKLAQGMEPQLYIDGLKVVLPLNLPDRPQVWLLASGETRPFDLTIGEYSGDSRTLHMDAFGHRREDDEVR